MRLPRLPVVLAGRPGRLELLPPELPLPEVLEGQPEQPGPGVLEAQLVRPGQRGPVLELLAEEPGEQPGQQVEQEQQTAEEEYS